MGVAAYPQAKDKMLMTLICKQKQLYGDTGKWESERKNKL